MKSPATVHSLLATIDQPPKGLITPPGAQHLAQLLIGAVVMAMLVAALWRWRATGRPTGVLLLLGGALCSLNEAPVDLLGHCWFPPDRGIGYAAFGYAVPWWVITAYVAFFGGLTWLTTELLATGPSRRTMWTAIGVVWILNLILELPILAAGVYLYYGSQPFMVGGFPLNWLFINGLGSLLAAVLTHRLSWWFTGARRALLVLVPYATYFASWVCHMPLFITLNAELPAAARWAAALVSAIITVAVMDGLVSIGVAGRRLGGVAHSGSAEPKQMTSPA